MQTKKQHPEVKSNLHPRNKHLSRYDLQTLSKSHPPLSSFIKINKYNDESIDFFDPIAVKMLNTSLLIHYYNIEYWDVPEGYLCPPIPGRADYIHYMADLLSKVSGDNPKNEKINCLDIGTGANCIYPIIGSQEYGWKFIGSEIDSIAVEAAESIISKNKVLKGKIKIKKQNDPTKIFETLIDSKEKFDLTICNPPFHASAKEAETASLRKLRNLKGKNVKKVKLNFGGQNQELWCPGGESKFVIDMIYQSKKFRNHVLWFSSLVSKESNLEGIYKTFRKLEPKEVHTIPMGQGNKKSRIVAWTFHNKNQQKAWAYKKWC